jgi:hypothetical protein
VEVSGWWLVLAFVGGGIFSVVALYLLVLWAFFSGAVRLPW